MKKILFIVTQSEFGGAQRFLAHLIDGLRRDTQIDPRQVGDTQKHADNQRESAYSEGQNQRVSANHYEIVVAAGPRGDDKAGLLSFLEKKGINTRHLKYLRRGVNPLFDFLGLVEIRKLIRKEKPDTIFLCSSKAGVLGSLAAHLYRRYARIVSEQSSEHADIRGKSASISVLPEAQDRRVSANTQKHADVDKEFLYSDITYKIRGACFKVWKQFRGAFKEKIIENALMTELENYGLKIETQKRIPISYEGKEVGVYVPDAIVNDKVLIELKSKPRLTKEDQKQFWLYLKGSKYKLGLLINFGKQLEIKRKVYDTARNNSASISVLPEAENQRVSAKSPKVIYRVGGWAFNDPRSSLSRAFYKFIEKFSAKWKDIIIFNSEHDRKQAIELKIKPKGEILTVYNGLDIDKLKFLSREKAREKLINLISNCSNYSNQILSPNDQLVGTVANLYPAKGLEYLVKAASILNRRNTQIDLASQDTQKHADNQRKSAYSEGHNQRVSANIKFVVIGEGQERKKLEDLIKKYHLENSFFLIGAIPDAYKYLKAFDVFVLPSVKEGFPWTILEAMAAEVPIVATKVGAIPEIIENKKTGFLVESKSPKELSEAIQRLIRNPEVRKNLTNSARKIVEQKFSLNKMVSKIEKLL